MKAKRPRRTGATQTIGVSLDVATKRRLKILAKMRHHGNVSALITEMTEQAVRRHAFEAAWLWYGGEEPSSKVRAQIDAELEEGWTLARKSASKKSKRRAAA